jgi:hypothetical protein
MRTGSVSLGSVAADLAANICPLTNDGKEPPPDGEPNLKPTNGSDSQPPPTVIGPKGATAVALAAVIKHEDAAGSALSPRQEGVAPMETNEAGLASSTGQEEVDPVEAFPLIRYYHRIRNW